MNIFFSRYKFGTCFVVNELFVREKFFTNYLERSAVSVLLN